MARAFCDYDFDNATPGAAADQFIVPVKVLYAGSDLPAGKMVDHDILPVTLTFTDSLNVMQTKIVDAVVARATSIGYTLARNGVLMLSLVKGS